MSFVGQLSKFQVPDLLQMISSTGRTGKLSLTRRDCKGVVVFRGGKIIYAATTTLPRETLGSALIGEGLLDASELERAVELQSAAGDSRRLGTVLTGERMVEHEDLERVIQQQLQKVIAEFMGWRDGFFRFELLDLPAGEEIEVDAADFLLEDGLGTDHVLLSIAVELDELEKERQAEGAAAGGDDPPTDPDADEVEASARLRAHSLTDLSSLKAMMKEVRSPEFTGEMTSQVLEFARGRFGRGVLFTVGSRHFHGIGGFGASGPDAHPISARGISLPSSQPSILREVLDRGESYCGELPFLPMNQRLTEQLGGGQPGEVAVLPLTVNGRVLLVFYADNLPDDAPIGSLAEMELLLLQVGLAMEKRLLAERVKELEMMQHLLRQA